MAGKGPISPCKMCLNVGELQDSHLLPASVYRKLHSVHLRDPRNPNPDPIAVTARKVRQTSKQTTDYLLCPDCEGLLDRMGEKHVLPLLANELGFPLHDLLSGVAPNVVEPEFVAYACARIPALDCEKIAHFAAGIFWKAAIHEWAVDGSTVKIDFRGYEDAFRHYLLGGTPFPGRAALTLRVVPPGMPSLSAVAPIEARDPSLDMYWFYVPGIEFRLYIGDRTPPEIRQCCFVQNQAHPVIVDPTVAISLGGLFRESILGAKMSTRLAAVFDEDTKA